MRTRFVRRSFYGAILLCMLLLAACGSQPTGSSGSTPTAQQSTPSPTPTTAPTATPTPAPTIATTPVTSLGANLIMNGNAEQGQCATATDAVITTIPGWTPKAEITPLQYAASGGDLDATSPGPSDRGNCYFWGGPNLGLTDNTTTNMTQTVDVSAFAQQIDGQSLTYQLSAWLGGYSSQDDNATLQVQFMGTSNNVLQSQSLGPVKSNDRQGTSELVSRSASGAVPAGTRSVLVTLTMTKTDGGDNDGLADDISLIFQAK